MKWRLASLVIALASACASVETKQPEPAAPAPIALERASLTAPLTSTAPQPESTPAMASPAAPTPLEVHFIVPSKSTTVVI